MPRGREPERSGKFFFVFLLMKGIGGRERNPSAGEFPKGINTSPTEGMIGTNLSEWWVKGVGPQVVLDMAWKSAICAPESGL